MSTNKSKTMMNIIIGLLICVQVSLIHNLECVYVCASVFICVCVSVCYHVLCVFVSVKNCIAFETLFVCKGEGGGVRGQ